MFALGEHIWSGKAGKEPQSKQLDLEVTSDKSQTSTRNHRSFSSSSPSFLTQLPWKPRQETCVFGWYVHECSAGQEEMQIAMCALVSYLVWMEFVCCREQEKRSHGLFQTYIGKTLT